MATETTTANTSLTCMTQCARRIFGTHVLLRSSSSSSLSSMIQASEPCTSSSSSISRNLFFFLLVCFFFILLLLLLLLRDCWSSFFWGFFFLSVWFFFIFLFVFRKTLTWALNEWCVCVCVEIVVHSQAQVCSPSSIHITQWNGLHEKWNLADGWLPHMRKKACKSKWAE